MKGAKRNVLISYIYITQVDLDFSTLGHIRNKWIFIIASHCS